MTPVSGEAAPSTSRTVPSSGPSPRPRSLRLDGLRMRTPPSRSVTIRPAVRLATIWPLSRSDASARAAIARSWDLSSAIASSSACDSSAVSPM